MAKTHLTQHAPDRLWRGWAVAISLLESIQAEVPPATFGGW